MNKFHSWCTRSEKRGILILVKKSCGVNYDNIVELDNSTAIMDLIMPDGLIINTLAVYGPSHEDDSKYWVKVRKSLDEREGDAQLILGDFNSTLDLDRDTMNYVSDPHSKVRPLLRQWLLNRDFLDVYDEFHPGELSFTWFQNKNDVYCSNL